MTPVLVCRILLPLLGLLGPLIVLLGLPGTWLLLALAGLAEWWTEPRLFSDVTLVGTVLVALAGEAWESLSSSVRARRAGAGRRGAIGALVGGIAGAIAGTALIPIPLFGTLVGGALGAFTVAALLETTGGRTLKDAVRIGRAAAAGQMIGLVGKLAASGVVYVWIVVALYV
ncbi:MAG: DUF456 family protein [Planctomycetota bacterium]